MRDLRTVRLIVLLVLVSLVWIPLGVHAQAPARVGFFEAIEIAPGDEVEVPVEVRGVADLYGMDLEIRFDPNILQAVDADPDKPGVQPGLGTFLEAGLTLFNEVDNDEGVVRFVMTQVNPAEPKSGDGVLLVLYFTALQEGDMDLVVETVELAARTGEGIEAAGEDGLVTVRDGVVNREGTPIPVQDPTLIIVIPTLAPTPTPTPTEIPPTATPTVEQDAVDDITPVEDSDEIDGDHDENGETERRSVGASILDYWWAVLIVAGLAAGLGVYVLKTRQII